MIIDSREAGRRMGISRMRVVQLLNAGRILNATKLGGQRGTWAIEVEGDAVPVVIGDDRRRKKE